MDPQGRSQLVGWLNYFYDFLGRYEALWAQRNGLEQKLQPEQPQRTKWKMWVIAPFALGIMFLAFTVFARPTGMITNLVLLPFWNVQTGDPLDGLVRVLVRVVPVLLCIGLAIAVVTLRNRVLLPRANARIAVTNQRRLVENEGLFAQIQGVDARIAEADQEFQQHIAGHLADRYHHQSAIAYLSQMVSEKRADSLKEAINLYERKLAEDREEMRHQQSMAQSERIRRQVAVGSVVNATITGAGIGMANANAKAARAQSAANTQRVVDAVNKPKTVWVKRG